MKGNVMSEQFKPGDKVHWTHTSAQGRSISMTRREGTIVEINDQIAVVLTSSKRRIYIHTSRLRLNGRRGQIDEFVDAVREAHRP